MTEQERFEVAYENTHKPIIARPYPKLENSTYRHVEIAQAWDLWQAATAQVVPEGFVVVPVEPSNAMLNYGMDHFNGAFIEGGATGIASLEFAYKAMIKATQENDQ